MQESHGGIHNYMEPHVCLIVKCLRVFCFLLCVFYKAALTSSGPPRLDTRVVLFGAKELSNATGNRLSLLSAH